MRIVDTIPELRAALSGTERSLGLVPTMGALHAGHESLIERAADDCKQVVVSAFVNPFQFNEPSDLETYPRDEGGDAALAERAGATILFRPSPAEIYPPGFSTSVQVNGALTETLEAAERGPGHFHGVTTVVTKLLNLVGPDIVYFGQKDAQQALVIRRLVADLNFGTEVVVLPTVREPDGLALSSRNQLLDDAERQHALALIRGLNAAAEVAGTTTDPAAVRAAALAPMAASGITPEYLELVDPESLHPVMRVNGNDVLIAVAARVGDVRLIDNLLIRKPDPEKAN